MSGESSQATDQKSDGYRLIDSSRVEDAPLLMLPVDSTIAAPDAGPGYDLSPEPEPTPVWVASVRNAAGASDAPNGRRSPPEFDDQRQFSLRSLLALLTISAAVMALSTRLSPPIFAAIMGVAALLAHWLLAAFRSGRLVLQLAAWLVLAGYLISALAAVAKG